MTKRNLRSKQPTTLGEDAELLFQKKIRDLESVNESLKLDVEELRSKLAVSSSGGTLLSSRDSSNKSIAKKEEGMSSRSKSNPRSMCSTKKHTTESCVKQVDSEVQKLKAQKVKLQCKIKLDSMQFRLSKASLEKETLQLKKELRKSEFEKHVLSALNRRQKQILQLKNTQALTALKRLKLLLQPKKTFSKKNNGLQKGTSSTIQAEESSNEVGLLVKLNKIHSGYERQMKEIAEEVKRFSLEASVLKAEFEGEQNSFSPSCDNGIINQTPIDSELKELKEEFTKLSTLVSQMEMAKSQFSQTDTIQTGPAEYSVPSKDNCESNLVLSQERTSEGTVYDESSIEPSQVKESGETLSSEEVHCKKEQIKAEMCCSCTKKSLCKTKSCKCRANGSGCGISCGCIASKCSNRGENVRSNKAMQAAVDGKKPVDDTKDATKQPLRDIGNIQEAGKVGKLRKVQKPVAKK